jgi:hypothetical protein
MKDEQVLFVSDGGAGWSGQVDELETGEAILRHYDSKSAAE